MSFAPANRTNSSVDTAILSDAKNIEAYGIEFPRKEATWLKTNSTAMVL